MNRIIVFILMLPIYIHINCSDKMPATNLLHALIDKDNQPTSPLLKLLQKTGPLYGNALPSILAASQRLLRSAGTERWENQTNILPDAEHLRLFKELYLIQEIVPTQKSYDYALLLGGVLEDVHIRLGYLIDLWKNKGIRFKSLIILTGQRTLDKKIESKDSLLRYNIKNLPLPTTEPEMIKFVLAQTNLPAEWRNHSFSSTLVDTPMQKMVSGSLRRPNTEDTVIEWLREHNPRPGKILAISNQPFVGYQNAVLQKNMPHFIIETVGTAYSDNESVSTILDALARWVYNEVEIRVTQNQQAKY